MMQLLMEMMIRIMIEVIITQIITHQNSSIFLLMYIDLIINRVINISWSALLFSPTHIIF